MNFGSHMDGVVATAAALVNVGTPGERQGRAYAVPTGPDLHAALLHAVTSARTTSGKVHSAGLLDTVNDYYISYRSDAHADDDRGADLARPVGPAAGALYRRP